MFPVILRKNEIVEKKETLGKTWKKSDKILQFRDIFTKNFLETWKILLKIISEKILKKKIEVWGVISLEKF